MSTQDVLRYDKMVEGALRGVVRQAIQEVMKDGLPGDHHFYITFMTDYPGVQIPDYLRERYPGEMTIVLQYQFYELSVDEEKMGGSSRLLIFCWMEFTGLTRSPTRRIFTARRKDWRANWERPMRFR